MSQRAEAKRLEAIRNVVESVAVGIWHIASDGTTLYVNRTMARMLEVDDAGSLQGVPYHGFFTPATLDAMNAVERNRIPGEPTRYEVTMVGRRGTRRDLLLSSVRLSDDRSGDLGYLGAFVDISDLKQAHTALAAVETRYRELFDNATEGIYQLDSEGHPILCNAALARILGYASPEALIEAFNRPGACLYVEPSRRDEFIGRLREGGKVEDFESAGYRADGSMIWLRESARAVRGPGGELLFYEGTLSDVSARKRAEDEIREKSRQLGTIIEAMAEGLAILDREGGITFVNAAAERILGVARAEVVGLSRKAIPWLRSMRVNGILLPPHRMPFEVLRSGEAERVEGLLVQLTRPDGREVFLTLNAIALRDAQGRFDGSVTTFTDVTARHDAERRARRAAVETRTSQERLGRALDASRIALFDLDAITGVIFLSEGWARMLGAPPGPTRTTVSALLEMVHPSEREQLLKKATDAIKGATAGYDVEHRVRTHAGEWMWILSRARVMERSADGRALRISGTNVDITARVRARESEEKFQALWEASNDAILLVDDENVIRYANPAVRQIFDWDPEELVGKGIEALQTAGQRRTPLEGFALFLASGSRVGGRATETVAKRRDGREVPIEITLSQVPIGDGMMIAAFIRDITTRRQGRDLRAGQRRVLEIMSSEASLETTLAALIEMIESLFPGMLCTALLLDDAETTFVHAAPDRLPASYSSRIIGEPIGPAAGSCGTAAWRKELVIVEDIAADPLWERYRELALAHDLRACWSNPIIASNGRVLGTFAMYYREPKAPGQRELEAVRIAASLAGIAIERKRAAEAIVVHARHESLVAEFGRFAIQTRDLDAVMAEASAKVCQGLDLEFCKILELRPHEDAFLLRAGHGWPEGLAGSATIGTGTRSQAGYCFETRRPVIVEDFRKEARFGMSALNRDAQILSGVDVLIERRGGPFGVLSAHSRKARRYTPEDVSFLQAMANGVAAAIERHETEARLSQAQKMEAIGGLAGGIAHDFNNILGAILGYSEMIQETAEVGSGTRKYVDIIASAGERGKQLVAQILAFSRATATEVGPVEVKLLVREVIVVLKGSLPANIRVEEAFPDAPVVAVGNATHLYQLVMNLCTNAVQAMPEGGTLRLAISFDTGNGRRIALAIEDEGEGIPEEMLPRIFEPFFSGRQRGRGTGLGLAIAHRIVTNHGGAIEVESRVGTGSRFTVYLPESTGSAAFDGAGRAQAPRGNGETVLIVDDEPELMQLAQETLAQLGYEPVGYSSSERAWNAFVSDPARFDAVVTDEVMPGLTGTELCTRIREKAAIPIVLVSGYGGVELDSRARTAGASVILKKPYLKHELATALAGALEKNRRA